MVEDAAQAFFRRAVELGMTFWDTANVYSTGSSAEIVGRAMLEYGSRDNIVLATMVHFPMHDGSGGSGGSGQSRKAIMENIDASLGRLRTDDVDLYHIHPFDAARRRRERLDAIRLDARPIRPSLP